MIEAQKNRGKKIKNKIKIQKGVLRGTRNKKNRRQEVDTQTQDRDRDRDRDRKRK